MKPQQSYAYYAWHLQHNTVYYITTASAFKKYSICTSMYNVKYTFHDGRRDNNSTWRRMTTVHLYQTANRIRL
jgi:hypothetical protein